MRTIHKFLLAPPFIVQADANAKWLYVGEQFVEDKGYYPFIWAEVDTTAIEIKHKFAVVGTGHEVPIGATYIGTVGMDNNTIMLHVYWEK